MIEPPPQTPRGWPTNTRRLASAIFFSVFSLRFVFLALCVAFVVALVALPMPMKFSADPSGGLVGAEPPIRFVELSPPTPLAHAIELIIEGARPIGFRMPGSLDLRLGYQVTSTREALAQTVHGSIMPTSVPLAHAGALGGIEASFDCPGHEPVEYLRRVDAWLVAPSADGTSAGLFDSFVASLAATLSIPTDAVSAWEPALWPVGNTLIPAAKAVRMKCHGVTIIVASTKQRPEYLRIALLDTMDARD